MMTVFILRDLDLCALIRRIQRAVNCSVTLITPMINNPQGCMNGRTTCAPNATSKLKQSMTILKRLVRSGST